MVNKYYAYYLTYAYVNVDHLMPMGIKSCTVYLPHELLTVEDLENVIKELMAEMNAEGVVILFFARIESNGKVSGKEVVVDGGATQ